jgi:hypothetical protein
VNKRSLRKRRQHFVRRLRFEEHFPGTRSPLMPLFLINRMEIGIRHPGGIEWIDGTSSVCLIQLVLYSRPS